MVNLIDKGLVPKDDPMFSTGPEIFSRQESNGSTTSSTSSSDSKTSPEVLSAEEQEKVYAMWEQVDKKILDHMRSTGVEVLVEEPSEDGPYIVTFPPNRSKAKQPKSTKSATITVEWGYECHSITLSPSEWAAVKSGEPLGKKGSGYSYEGKFFQDYWDFDGGLDGRLVVSYGDDGGCGFDGYLSDATITLHEKKQRGSC